MTTIDLAASQQRILLRQRLRAEREQAAREAQRNRYASTFLARAPRPLKTLTWKGFETWETIKGRDGTNPAFRVGQVDAELLDEELLQLLRAQVGDGLRLLGVSLSMALRYLYEIEADTILISPTCSTNGRPRSSSR